MADVDLAQLSTSPIFAGLDETDLRSLAAEATTGELRPGDTLFEQGSPADAFFVILEGKVSLFVRSSGGTDQRLASLGPGMVLGETSLLLRDIRSVTAKAETATRLLRFSNAQFVRLLDASYVPALQVVRNLARVLAARLRSADSQIAELCKDDGASTVAEDDLDRLRRIFFSDWALSPGS
jgi:CRP-like cAMP-binding protein